MGVQLACAVMYPIGGRRNAYVEACGVQPARDRKPDAFRTTRAGHDGGLRARNTHRGDDMRPPGRPASVGRGEGSRRAAEEEER